MNAALEACPFCGELPYIEKKPLWRTYNDGTTHGYYNCFEYDIHCHTCGCIIPLPGNDTIYRSDAEAKQNAINAWNKRAVSINLSGGSNSCENCRYITTRYPATMYPCNNCLRANVDRKDYYSAK